MPVFSNHSGNTYGPSESYSVMLQEAGCAGDGTVINHMEGCVFDFCTTLVSGYAQCFCGKNHI